MRRREGYIAECLAGEYEEWDQMTVDQQTIMVLEVETRMEEDGLNEWGAIRELQHFRIKGNIMKYVLELQIIARVTCILLLVLAAGCGEPAWKAELVQQCAAWRAMARTHSDSLNVTMNCASIYASHEARDAANDAAAMSAGAMGMASSAAVARSSVPR